MNNNNNNNNFIPIVTPMQQPSSDAGHPIPQQVYPAMPQQPVQMPNPAFMQAPPGMQSGMQHGMMPGMQPAMPPGYVQAPMQQQPMMTPGQAFPYPAPDTKPGMQQDDFNNFTVEGLPTASDPNMTAIHVDMDVEGGWSIDGVDVSTSSDLGHCCAAFWLPSCYVAGMFCGGRLNKCGLLTIIISCVITLCLLLFGFVSSLMGLILTMNRVNEVDGFNFSFIISAGYAIFLIVYGLVMKKRAEEDPHHFITVSDTRTLLMLGFVEGTHFVVAGLFFLTCLIAVGIFASTMVLHILSSISGIVISVVFIAWAHGYYSRMIRIRNVDGKELVRWKILSFDPTDSPVINL